MLWLSSGKRDTNESEPCVYDLVVSRIINVQVNSMQNEFSLFPPSVVVSLAVTAVSDAFAAVSKATVERDVVVKWQTCTDKTSPLKICAVYHTINIPIYCIKNTPSTPLKPVVVDSLSVTVLPGPIAVLAMVTAKCTVVSKPYLLRKANRQLVE